MAYDLESIDREVQRNLQFDPIYQQSDRYAAINDTILDLVSATEFTDDPFVADTEVGKIEYALPDNTIKITEVMFGRYWLKPMTRSQWVQAGGNQITVNGTPSRYWIRNNSFLNLWVAPDSVKQMSIFTVQQPDPLAVATDVPVLPQYCFQGIVNGTCWRLTQNETEMRDQSQDFERKYLRDVSKLTQKLNRNKRMKVRQVVFY